MRRAALGEVAIVSMLRSFRARCIDFAAVEARTLVRIAQEVVGHRDVLEFLFGFLVATLRPGDYVELPAHTKHRIEWTDADRPTVWLTVHLEGPTFEVFVKLE